MRGYVVDQAVVTGGERIVHNDLDVLPGEAAELIGVVEAVEEGGGPAVSSACGLAGFCEPHGLTWRVAVAQTGVKGVDG